MLTFFFCALGFLVIVTLYSIVVALCADWPRPEWESFDERFPPLSDEEFLSKCQPGTDPEVALKVRNIIADCLGVDPRQVYPEARLVRDLGA